MKRGEILRKLYEAGPCREGMDALEKGTEMVARDLNALVNTYGEDLPLLVACIKSSMPHWERHLGESGMQVCSDILSLMMTVDASMLRGEGE